MLHVALPDMGFVPDPAEDGIFVRYIPHSFCFPLRVVIFSLLRPKRRSPPIYPMSRRGFSRAKLCYPLRAMPVCPIGASGGRVTTRFHALFDRSTAFMSIACFFFSLPYRSWFLSPIYLGSLCSEDRGCGTEGCAWHPSGPFLIRNVWCGIQVFLLSHPERMVFLSSLSTPRSTL